MRVEVGRPTLTAAHLRLFNAYHEDMHRRRGWPLYTTDERDYWSSFLAGDFDFAYEFRYWRQGALVGVGLVDATDRSLSSATSIMILPGGVTVRARSHCWPSWTSRLSAACAITIWATGSPDVPRWPTKHVLDPMSCCTDLSVTMNNQCGTIRRETLQPFTVWKPTCRRSRIVFTTRECGRNASETLHRTRECNAVNATTSIYEKLGVFYLGREFDLQQRKCRPTPVLYDSRDLLTHAVIMGMTGSGKTGLGISLLEEAAIDSIPALIVDPKGDLGNLLLTFPDLQAADFAPWLHAEDAQRAGLSVEEFAARQATSWREGLAQWDQDGQRIARLREAAEFQIFTPGSEAGRPVSILASFAVPPQAVLQDTDLLREGIATTTSSLLGLLGLTADPLRSREHILLANILEHAWKLGQDLELGTLIQRVQNPPFSQVGVLDIESFFPARERFELAIRLNNLLAAPGFAAWLQGEPLDVDRLLYSPSGKPRLSIFSIGHLSDAERMFFVSLLLNQTLGWMRSRSGTTSLRALLYIDEIMGYVPPVAEPPSKKPLLTLLKQARAFGLGIVLATQNPVDLDYKGLANTGTWFIGRLQTERDRQRVLEGLSGTAVAASKTWQEREASELLSSLGQRVFLMHNVHEDAPVVFQTRWTMSFLAGPLTRQQVRSLVTSRQERCEHPPEPQPTEEPPAPRALAAGGASTRPLVPPELPQVFLPHAAFRCAPASWSMNHSCWPPSASITQRIAKGCSLMTSSCCCSASTQTRCVLTGVTCGRCV